MARVVTVARDEYTIRFGGDILPNARYRITGDYRYVPQASASEMIASGSGYGRIRGRASVLDIEDPGRDFALPGEPGEIGNIHFGATYPPGDGDRRTASGVDSQHLKVDPDYRGEGVGGLLFDFYRAMAVYVGGHATGDIGTDPEDYGEADFLERQGIDRADMHIGSSAWNAALLSWESDSAALRDAPGVEVTVEDGVDFGL